MRTKQFRVLLLVFGVLAAASRLPLSPKTLFSFDDVNFAYALEEFDPRISQPQPPGYPLFVLEMRVLRWAGVERPETILRVVAWAGTTAALIGLAVCGERVLGAGAGVCAAWLLLFHPSFWFAGLTSALRVQLAVISVLVAAACDRAWKGERRWMYVSAVALGIGAGIRPSLGLLLLPLWAVAAWRCAGPRRRLRPLARGSALLAMTVLLWLVPTVWQAGGVTGYFQTCWSYLRDQAAVTSALFGAPEPQARFTIVSLVVWTLSGTLLWPVWMAASWRRGEGFSLPGDRLIFLALWMAPSFLFAWLVHIADPGQALAMVPVVCLVGGYFLSRATRRLEPWVGAEHGLLILVLPALALNCLLFLGRFAAPRPSGGRVATIWSGIYDSIDASSLWHFRRVSRLDDQALEQVRRLGAETPGRTTVVWAGSSISWRKIAYYLPDTPVTVLAADMVRAGSPPLARRFLGSQTEFLSQAAESVSLALTPGERLIWLVEPESVWIPWLRRNFAVRRAGPVYYHDLPKQGGPSTFGHYRLVW
jgi:hypothetical protein